MQLKTLVAVALATLVAANDARVPYKLASRKSDLVALARRADLGYQPEQTYCGDGETCAAACGAGYDQCASTDGLTHCFNASAGEKCCQDAAGNACESGYYCAVDKTAGTWCCPDGMSTSDCATAYSVTGGLSSLVPTTTASSGATATGSTVSKVTSAGSAGTTGGSHGGSTNGTATATRSPTPSAQSTGAVTASGTRVLVGSGLLGLFGAAVAALL